MSVSPEFQILGIFTYSIAMVSCTVILLTSLYQLHGNTTYHPSKYCTPKKCMQNLTFIAILFFIIAMISGILLHCYLWNIVQFNIIVAMIEMPWNMAQVFIYILLMSRVYYAFKGTKYESTKITKISFSILLIMYIVCSIADIQARRMIVEGDTNGIDIKIYRYLWVIGSEIVDLIICVFLIVVFTNKMTLVAANMDDISYSYSFEENNDDEIQLNQRQKILSDIMTKYFILSVISTISTQLSCLTFSITSMDPSEFGPMFTGETLTVFRWLIVIMLPSTSIINTICLFLTLDINDALYMRCCRKCAVWIGSIYQKKTKKKIRKSVYELRTRLLTEGSNVSMIQNSISRNSKISSPKISDHSDVSYYSYNAPPMELEVIDNNNRFETWNEHDVLTWILNIADGLFMKYKKRLETVILNSKVSGLDLLDVTMDDIERFGIKTFSEQKLLQKEITKLKQIYQAKKQNEGAHKETNYL